MSISPLGHPLLSRLLGDDAVASLFNADAEYVAAEAFEIALARVTAAHGFIPGEAAKAIEAALGTFTPDLELLAETTERDGVIVPGLVAQMRTHIGELHGKHLHFGATSQDVVDTSLILRLRDALRHIETGLTEVVGALFKVEEQFGTQPMMAVTRMQEALPITVADRVRSWRAPLVRHLERIEEIKSRLLIVQFGGAVGTLHMFGDKADVVTQSLADELGLGAPEHNWHSQRDIVVEFASWLSLVTGSLGKMGQDLALMAQNSVGEVTFAGGGGSSAMPHKQNPVGAEMLVTLARFNATEVSAMHQALVHESERSGAAWTLEWMVLPQMVVATAGALRRAKMLLGSVEDLGRPSTD